MPTMPPPNPLRAEEEAKLVIREKERIRDLNLKGGLKAGLNTQIEIILVVLFLVIVIGALMLIHFQ